MAETDDYGQIPLRAGASPFHQTDFMIQQRLAQVRTSVPIKVVAVHGGGLDKPPIIDVQLMVKQADGKGASSSHGTIYGIPVARHQFGETAIIMDPSVGDVMLMHVSDRDISSLNANEGAESTPGSKRRHSLSDGVVSGGAMMHGKKPTRYIMPNSDGGWDMVDPHGNKIATGASGTTISRGGGSIAIGADGKTSFSGGGNLA